MGLEKLTYYELRKLQRVLLFRIFFFSEAKCGNFMKLSILEDNSNSLM